MSLTEEDSEWERCPTTGCICPFSALGFIQQQGAQGDVSVWTKRCWVSEQERSEEAFVLFTNNCTVNTFEGAVIGEQRKYFRTNLIDI